MARRKKGPINRSPVLHRDPARRDIFFAQFRDELEYCSNAWPNHELHRAERTRQLISAIRSYFGYSPSTVDVDILQSVVQGFRRLRSTSTPQSHY
jgi:hypothetical protein